MKSDGLEWDKKGVDDRDRAEEGGNGKGGLGFLDVGKEKS